MLEPSSLQDKPTGKLSGYRTKVLCIPVLQFVWVEYCLGFYLGKYSPASWTPQIRKMNGIIPRFSSQHQHFLSVASCNCAPKTFIWWTQRLVGQRNRPGWVKNIPKWAICQCCYDKSYEERKQCTFMSTFKSMWTLIQHKKGIEDSVQVVILF